jgi:hypothetical protein
LHAASQRFAEDRPTPIDLAQAGVAAALGDGGEAIDPLDIVEFLGECICHEGVHALAGAGKKCIDQRHGVLFAPGVLLRDLFRLMGLGIVQEFVNVQSDAVKNLIDAVDSVRFIPSTLVCQRLRRICLVFGKIVLKNFRKIVRKLFRVQIVVELSNQEIFQRFKSKGSDQTPFQAAPPQDVPFQGHYVGYENLIDNIDWLYRRADTREKLVIVGGVFALNEQRRTKQLIPAPVSERWVLRFPSCFCSSWTQTPPYARQNESLTRTTLYIDDSGIALAGRSAPSLWEPLGQHGARAD